MNKRAYLTETRQLTELGAQNLIDGRNSISFCNVLFVGNLCALISLTAIYGRQWNFSTLKQLSKSDWLGLLAVAFFSGSLAPALIFSALEQTAVNNVILDSNCCGRSTLVVSRTQNYKCF